MPRVAIVLSLFLLLAVACRSEEKPRYTVAEAEGFPRHAAVIREDLRVSLVERARTSLTRDELTFASGLFAAPEVVELVAKTGAVTGYVVDYDTNPTATDLSRGWVISVHQELAFHNTEAGAAFWLDYAFAKRDELTEVLLDVLSTDPELDDVQAEDVPAPFVGDDAFALRIATNLTRDNRPFDVVHDLVFWRRGEISAFMIVVATRDRQSIVDTILTNADDRIALSLEQGPPPE